MKKVEQDLVGGVRLVILCRKEKSMMLFGKLMVYNIYLN